MPCTVHTQACTRSLFKLNICFLLLVIVADGSSMSFACRYVSQSLSNWSLPHCHTATLPFCTRCISWYCSSEAPCRYSTEHLLIVVVPPSCACILQVPVLRYSAPHWHLSPNHIHRSRCSFNPFYWLWRTCLRRRAAFLACKFATKQLTLRSHPPWRWDGSWTTSYHSAKSVCTRTCFVLTAM